MELLYYTADVFTDQPFHGAQIAVVPEATGLDGARMQLIAREINLTETVFLFPRDDESARDVRSFSPWGESTAPGHPLIAAAYVLAVTGRIETRQKYTPLVLHLAGGPVDMVIIRDQGKPLFAQFTVRARPSVDRFVPTEAELAAILSLTLADIQTRKYAPMLVSAGMPYLVVPLKSYAAVRKARFDFNAWSQTTAPATLGREMLVFATHAESSADFHLRLVGPQIGVNDDPPIGASIPAFAGYLCAHEHIKQGIYSFTAERGEARTRRSVLSIEMDNTNATELILRVGGPAVLMTEARMRIPDVRPPC